MNSKKVFILLTTIYFLFCAWLYSLIQIEEVIQGMMLFTFLSFIMLVCTDKDFWTKKSIRTFYRFWIIVDCIFVLIPYMFFTEDSLTFLNDYARITDVEYRAVLVDEPGQTSKVSVTERITFDVHAISKNNLYWELWRDLPEIETDGVISKFDVKSVKQIKDDGSEIILEESPRLYWEDEDYVNSNSELGPNKWFHSPGPYNEYYRQYECVFFYVDGIYQEKLTFEIEYEMTNPALRYLDCSELYLCLYSEETTKYLESYKAEILIDNKDMPSKGNYKTYTFGTSANTFEYEESATKNSGYYTFSIELDEKDLKFTPANEYIEFSLVAFNEDKHKFTEYAAMNDYYFYNALSEIFEENDYYSNISKHYAKSRIITFLICGILSVIIIIYTFKRDAKMRKKYNILTPTTEYKYFRDIPSNLDPLFASTLVFCKDDNKKIKDGFSAIMLSLIRKKYIEVTRINPRKEWLSRNTRIQILPSANQSGIAQEALDVIQELYNVEFSFDEKQEPLSQIEPLTLSESYYFNLIKKHSCGLTITLHEFQQKISSDYVATDMFVRNIDNVPFNVGINDGYFQKVQYK